MFNKCRNGLRKLDKLNREDDEIGQAMTFIFIFSMLSFTIIGVILGSMV